MESNHGVIAHACERLVKLIFDYEIEDQLMTEIMSIVSDLKSLIEKP